MSVEQLDLAGTHVFGFKVTGKLLIEDLEPIFPEIEKAIKRAKNKLRLLIQVNEMHGADGKAGWEMFDFIKEYTEKIELIAIVGGHSWRKVMSQVLAATVFVQAETRYFKIGELKEAHEWLLTAAHPRHVPVRRVIDSDEGLFTKYSSPNYM